LFLDTQIDFDPAILDQLDPVAMGVLILQPPLLALGAKHSDSLANGLRGITGREPEADVAI